MTKKKAKELAMLIRKWEIEEAIKIWPKDASIQARYRKVKEEGVWETLPDYNKKLYPTVAARIWEEMGKMLKETNK